MDLDAIRARARIGCAAQDVAHDRDDLLTALEASAQMFEQEWRERAAATRRAAALEAALDTVLTRDGHFTFCTGGFEPEHGCTPTCTALRAALASAAGPESDVAPILGEKG